MNYLFDKAFQMVMVLLCFVLFLVFVILGAMFWNWKKRKGKRDEDEYYQELLRHDSQSFLDFEDIVDEMVISNQHRRFVAAIRCNGFDLYSASQTQVAATMQSYIEFLNTISSPITYRQYFVPMSMDYTRSMYESKYEEMERELFNKNADRDELLAQLNRVRGTNLVAEEALIGELEEIQKVVKNLEWRRLHLGDQIRILNAVCDSTSMEPSMEQVYLAEWEYVPGQYNMEMTEEDIHRKAIEELGGICRRMIASLGRCSVTAYRCTTKELIEMFYQQSHPLTSKEFPMPDVVNSPYFDSVVSTEDFEKKKEAAYEDAVLREGVRMAKAMDELSARDVFMEKEVQA